jgi:hypothetical protein
LSAQDVTHDADEIRRAPPQIGQQNFGVTDHVQETIAGEHERAVRRR